MTLDQVLKTPGLRRVEAHLAPPAVLVAYHNDTLSNWPLTQNLLNQMKAAGATFHKPVRCWTGPHWVLIPKGNAP